MGAQHDRDARPCLAEADFFVCRKVGLPAARVGADEIADASRRADSGGRSSPRGNESLRQFRAEAVGQPAVTPDGDRPKRVDAENATRSGSWPSFSTKGTCSRAESFALVRVGERRGEKAGRRDETKESESKHASPLRTSTRCVLAHPIRTRMS